MLTESQMRKRSHRFLPVDHHFSQLHQNCCVIVLEFGQNSSIVVSAINLQSSTEVKNSDLSD